MVYQEDAAMDATNCPRQAQFSYGPGYHSLESGAVPGAS